MSAQKPTAAVTGAFSYSGSYIARELIEEGWKVRTLTRRPGRAHALQGKIRAFPLDFSKPKDLVKNLQGVETLVNTYWVRFDHAGSSFKQAIENTRTLIRAAEEAGVRRLVHLSVSNPDLESSLPYYRGKAEVERLMQKSAVSYSILQPTLIFGREELLVNNITWLLRQFPLFPIPGNGEYRLQPIYVGDLAKLAAKAAASDENQIVPAGGPDVLSFEELIRFLAKASGSRVLTPHVPPKLALGMSKVLSFFLRDVLLTEDELTGLMEERLYVGEPITGAIGFRDWALENAELLGKRYTNELRRHHSNS